MSVAKASPVVDPKHRAVYDAYVATRKAFEQDSRMGDLKATLKELPRLVVGSRERIDAERRYTTGLRDLDRSHGYSRVCTRLGQAIAAGFVRPDKKQRKAPAA